MQNKKILSGALVICTILGLLTTQCCPLNPLVPLQAYAAETTISPSITFNTTSEWGNGYQGEIIIKNSGSTTFKSWELTFDCDSKIESLWGGQLVSQSGKKVTVTNCSWDSSFGPGATTSIGLVVSGSSKPSGFSFLGNGDNNGSSQAPSENPGNTSEPSEPTPENPPSVDPAPVDPVPTDKTNISEGWFYLKNVLSNKYLSVSNNSASAGSNVVINSFNGSDGQRWKLAYTGDGYFTLTSALGSFMLDVANGSAENGANIGIYHGYSGEAQRYTLQKTSKDGIYLIATKASKGEKVLDVYEHKTADGSNVCQWSVYGNPNQQWILEDASSGSSTTPPETTPIEPQPVNSFTNASFPTINADVPDLDIIYSNNAYYMVSTTMNMCPGVPVMKSTDLVHWRIVNYVYDTFENDAVTNLDYGKNMYSHGSWAASLKYDEYSKLYYVAFNSNDHGFYIYTTNNIETGKWQKHFIRASFHDPALFFENGNMYVISCAGGSCKLQQLSLSGDRINTVGSSKTLFTSNGWSLWEGAHAYKINGTYYIFVIASPNGRWIRTQLCYKSNSLTNGYWAEKTLFQGGVGSNGAGLAQGGIVPGPNNQWFGFAFQDAGAVGRVPSVVNISWENGWPMFKASGSGCTLGLPESSLGNYIVDSDDFSSSQLKLVWQWNHNPQNNYWSLTKNPGYLRLTTDRTVDNIYYAHNSLTQRTYGNKCQSETKLYTDNMKPGDYAGICSMADAYGMIGVMCNDRGERYIYQANGAFLKGFGNPNATSYQRISNNQAVYLKISYSFSSYSSKASFYYSLDGRSWTKLGNDQSLGFSTSTTFMGTRSWLFNYATKQAGGYVDFDYYKIYD